MLVFSRNKLISHWIKIVGRVPEICWADEIDGKPVRKFDNGLYGCAGMTASILPEWVAEVDNKYLGG